MDLGISSRLPLKCWYSSCPSNRVSGISKHLVRQGFYRRSSDGRRIPRFFCRHCHRSFSSARFSPCFNQRRRKLNEPIRRLLVKSVTMRGIARLLGTNYKTVVRKLRFLAAQSGMRHEAFLKSLRGSETRIKSVQFDELETFERSKCLPLSVPLVVHQRTRKILGLRVCSMPAKGLLAAASRKKYGRRPDHRRAEVKKIFTELKDVISSDAVIRSDQNPNYPAWIGSHFPDATHITYKGRRARTVGQGELKVGGFDPLFSLNHTCAMLRAHVSRLVRKTWATTKRADHLAAHLMIYLDHHNRFATKPI